MNNSDYMQEPLPEFVEKFTYINKTLIDYGWVISPHMMGKDFEKTYNLCQEINKDSTTINGSTTSNTFAQINKLLTPILFHPLTRAFFVFRAKELKYLSSFSHHIERGILHYLKNDFFSSVHCLLPAIEGSLLAYFGWVYGQGRKPSINVLINEIEKCRAQTRYPLRYKMYSGTLIDFLKRWIFIDTAASDNSFSFLNRHYIQHGMGNDNYYSLADTQRIIMFFDLFIEFLSLEQGIDYTFIPENNEKINERESYYFKLISTNLKKSFMDKIETKFMLENIHYYDEPNKPDFSIFLKAALSEYMELMHFVSKNKH